MEQKTNLPGIFLIVIGVLSILLALANLAVGLVQGPDSNPFLQSMGGSSNAQAESVGYFIGLFGACLLFLIASSIVILAGTKLRSLTNYNLAMAGTILAMIPCCTTWGCCLFATPIGIWSLVVLMDPNVKAAFR